MDMEYIKSSLNEIKRDVKEIRKITTKQGQDIAQLKVWAWVSRSALVVFLGGMVSWLKSKVN